MCIRDRLNEWLLTTPSHPLFYIQCLLSYLHTRRDRLQIWHIRWSFEVPAYGWQNPWNMYVYVMSFSNFGDRSRLIFGTGKATVLKFKNVACPFEDNLSYICCFWSRSIRMPKLNGQLHPFQRYDTGLSGSRDPDHITCLEIICHPDTSAYISNRYVGTT